MMIKGWVVKIATRLESNAVNIMDSKGSGFDGRHGACLIFVELFADDACVRGPCAYGGLDSTPHILFEKEQKSICKNHEDILLVQLPQASLTYIVRHHIYTKLIRLHSSSS